MLSVCTIDSTESVSPPARAIFFIVLATRHPTWYSIGSSARVWPFFVHFLSIPSVHVVPSSQSQRHDASPIDCHLIVIRDFVVSLVSNAATTQSSTMAHDAHAQYLDWDSPLETIKRYTWDVNFKDGLVPVGAGFPDPLGFVNEGNIVHNPIVICPLLRQFLIQDSYNWNQHPNCQYLNNSLGCMLTHWQQTVPGYGNGDVYNGLYDFIVEYKTDGTLFAMDEARACAREPVQSYPTGAHRPWSRRADRPIRWSPCP